MTGVVHVVTALERGGAQRIVLEAASALHDPGRPQIVVTGARVANGDASLDDEAERRLGTRLIRVRDLVGPVSPLRDAACVVELQRLFDVIARRVGSPIVVHTHSSKAGVVGRTAARAVRGVVVVHTVHGFGLEALGPRRRWILEAAERASGAPHVVVFVSEADRARAEELGLFAHGHATRVIRAGVDVKRFANVASARSSAAAGERTWPRAITIGNLKPQKDPLFHVEILGEWRKLDDGRDARLVLLGDGPLRGDVEKRARELGVEDALSLPGFVDDVTAYLADADVFLLASAWEGLPCSVVEATAAGLPCVVRDTGYASDLKWAKNVTALPVDAPAAAFAKALVDVTTRTPRIPKVPTAFTMKGMLRDLGELYDELIGLPRPTENLVGRRRASRAAGPRGGRSRRR